MARSTSPRLRSQTAPMRSSREIAGGTGGGGVGSADFRAGPPRPGGGGRAGGGGARGGGGGWGVGDGRGGGGGGRGARGVGGGGGGGGRGNPLRRGCGGRRGGGWRADGLGLRLRNAAERGHPVAEGGDDARLLVEPLAERRQPDERVDDEDAEERGEHGSFR